MGAGWPLPASYHEEDEEASRGNNAASQVETLHIEI